MVAPFQPAMPHLVLHRARALTPHRIVSALGCALAIAAGLATSTASAASPRGLGLSPDNPRYLAWNGKPLPVVGSGEHYGAVLNADFDTVRYLDTLRRDGLNHTRLFTGAAYVEPQGAFNIQRNTLAPRGERYLTPWARSGTPGYAGGGNRFDLEHWDEAYFARLHRFALDARRRGIVVEINLFCPFYEEDQWRLSPFNPSNNVQGAGQGVGRTNVYTLDHHGGLLAYQEKFVRRVVAELRDADNIYYEICNEPYFGGVTLEWQAHIARTIQAAQNGHPHPKLISQNIANGKERVAHPIPEVSLFNFHYANPPETVALNRHLSRPIGDNETGFRGTNDLPYRVEAWAFFLAGGALFSHLDYSFTAGFENGTFIYPASQPGGGNPTLRRQFAWLRRTLDRFPLVHSEPNPGVLRGPSPEEFPVYALVQPGQAVLAYIHRAHPDKPSAAPDRSLPLTAQLPPGLWRLEWFDPATGRPLGRARVSTSTDQPSVQLTSPTFRDDLVLRARADR